MKFIKWKSIVLTCSICLLPIFIGIALWNSLPDSMAIHFNIHNQADGFASKSFVVFGLPILMVVLQIICCVINDVNAKKHGPRVKFERATKWIIPVMTIVLQIITFGYNLGRNIDIRKSAAIIVGLIFILIGNYLPKFDYIKNHNVDTDKARKINRFIGFGNVIMGILIILSIFLPPIATVVWLILLIVYSIASFVYGIKVCKKK